jgi:hypothetical protein
LVEEEPEEEEGLFGFDRSVLAGIDDGLLADLKELEELGSQLGFPSLADVAPAPTPASCSSPTRDSAPAYLGNRRARRAQASRARRG